ncbi:hypothetical protein VBK23_17050, partial [Enterobacter hormaechei]|nr:hypothetical protein [Enterobacter hormaechei]
FFFVGGGLGLTLRRGFYFLSAGYGAAATRQCLEPFTPHSLYPAFRIFSLHDRISSAVTFPFS